MDTPRWLDDNEQRAWRAYLDATRLLMAALDRQLVRDSGLSLTDYELLVALSEAPGGRMRMSALADAVVTTRSGATRAIARLVDAWERDPDKHVRGAALAGFAGQDADAALKLARKRLGRPAELYESKADVEVIAAEGDGTDLARVLPLTEPGTDGWLRATSIYALGDIVEAGDDDKDRAKASRRLEALLADRDLRMRYIAVSLLGRIGDEASAPALVARAMGMNPSEATSAVISTGRSRMRAPSIAASSGSSPSWRFWTM